MLLPSVGVPVVISFHFYIFCMVPFASVMEWNVFCVLSAIYHFGLNTVTLPPALSPLLAVRSPHHHQLPQSCRKAPASVTRTHSLTTCAAATRQVFLVVVAGVVPLVGQLYPKLVPFLIAYRPYAGNWRFSWHVVDNKATHKLRKLKCVNRS